MAVLESIFPASGSPHYIYVASGPGTQENGMQKSHKDRPTNTCPVPRKGWLVHKQCDEAALHARQATVSSQPLRRVEVFHASR